MWPEPRSSIPGSSARASSIGASRLTRRRAGQLLGREVGQAPGAGQAGVGDEGVDGAGLRGQLLGRARLGEVGGDDAVAVAGQLRRHRSRAPRRCGR